MIRKRLAIWGSSVVATASAAALVLASAPIIGMASAQNGVTLDNAQVSGTATIFDGSTVQSAGFSRFHLNNGTRLDFAAGSKATLFATHEALSAGMTEVQSPSGFEVDTDLLKIRPTSANSIARVKIDGGKVYVTALNSSVSVSNAQGLLVAKVAPGMPMFFINAQGAAAPNSFKAQGCVVNKGGIALLSDDGTKAVSQLVGANLKSSIGSNVEIVGTIDATATAAGGASQVVKVSTVAIKRKGGCTAVASALGASASAAGLGAAAGAGAGAGAAAGAGAGAGAAAAGAGAAAGAAAGIGTTVAVVAGVGAAAAAGIGGAAAAGALSTPSP